MVWMSYMLAHWVRCYKSGEKGAGDRPRSDRTAMAATTEIKDKIDALIRDDRRITSELCAATVTGKLAVMNIIRKLATWWVPKMNTVEHRTARKSICAGLLQRSEKDGNVFLPRITGEETYVHHYGPMKNTIIGMASSGVATQEQIKGTDFC